ncbi:class I SAM-dependent methyltransferase [Pelagibacteraceae bacterium]|nr:class I SAM-dependent methyltransferase [Pelagibacteraceae bacterium]|tara:strand:- start:158 stop:814 length:657 start_codon:yes stop_codon:yes gene_type:complete
MGKNLEITSLLEKYIENFSYALHPIQKEIISYNESLGDIKRMQIAVSQCHFLQLIIRVSNSKKILEIGTFTGLSALSMSLALPDDGNVVALDKNTETNKIATNFFKKAKQEKKIKTIVKPALESINELKKENFFFDIVFIDADKDNYKKYYDSALGLTKKNGLIIIDNVLWHGEVADKNNNEKYTNIIRDFNEHVKNDKKTEQVIIPLGDGFTVCRKL